MGTSLSKMIAGGTHGWFMTVHCSERREKPPFCTTDSNVLHCILEGLLQPRKVAERIDPDGPGMRRAASFSNMMLLMSLLFSQRLQRLSIVWKPQRPTTWADRFVTAPPAVSLPPSFSEDSRGFCEHWDLTLLACTLKRATCSQKPGISKWQSDLHRSVLPVYCVLTHASEGQI